MVKKDPKYCVKTKMFKTTKLTRQPVAWTIAQSADHLATEFMSSILRQLTINHWLTIIYNYHLTINHSPTIIQ